MEQYITKEFPDGASVEAALLRAKAGGAIDITLANKRNWNAGIVGGISILDWAEAQSIATDCFCDTSTKDMPYSGYWMVTLDIFPAAGWKMLKAANILSGDIWYRNLNVNTWDAGWTQLATTAAPSQINIPLYDGFTKNGSTVYFKTQDGIVHCYGSVAGSFTAGVSTQFAMFPEGFRPPKTIAISASYRNTNGGGIGAALITVKQSSSGGYIDVTTGGDANYIYFDFSFLAEA